MGDRPYRRSFTVRTHLVLIIASVAVATLALGGVLAVRDYRMTHDRVEVAAASLAVNAAGALDEAITGFTASLVQTAMDPTVPTAFPSLAAAPESCALSSGALGVIPVTHIHFTTPQGAIFCSSAAPQAAQRNARIALPALGAQPVTFRLGRDPLTGEASIAIAVGVGSKKIVGAVVGTIPVANIAEHLEKQSWSSLRPSFEIVDAATGNLLGTSSVPKVVSWRTPRSTGPGPDGVVRIYERGSVKAVGWTVLAGVDESLAVAGARGRAVGQIVVSIITLAITMLAGFFVNRRIAKPLRRLHNAVAQAEREITPAPVAVGGPTEIRQLLDSFNGLATTTALQRQRLEHQTFHDDLTGLPNRVVLVDRLRNALQRAARADEKVAVLFVDVDRFRVINESLGHSVADAMLVEIGQRIGTVLRAGDTLARFSGDEFAILCEDLASHAQAGVVAERIARCLESPVKIGQTEATLTASIGIAVGNGSEDAERLLRQADVAMTQAKQRGRNRFEFFASTPQERASSRLELENDLRRAIERDQLVIHYQPEIDLRSGRVIGAEALLRWDHPTRGLIPPSEFIPLAEETGLIIPIGKHVIERACEQIAAWSDHNMYVSVNLSARQLGDRTLPSAVERALLRSGIPPQRLCLEVTESALVRGPEVIATLNDLKALGLMISIDDFGTGYSSLAYLQRLPVDQLKVDRSFVSRLGSGEGATAVVSAVLDLAKALDLLVVAEGVEEPEQMDELRLLGCDAAQGFLIMRPEPAAAVTVFLDAASSIAAHH